MSHCKPTPGNIRRRLARIEKDATEVLELAKRWNPKGRFFKAQRDLIAAAPLVVNFGRSFQQSIRR